MDILNLFTTHHPPLIFKPGDKYRYSNMGYIILALLIEKISGMTYEEFMKEKIFNPSGMTRTSVYRRQTKGKPFNDYAMPYIISLKHRGYVMPDSLQDHQRVMTLDGEVGAKSISSTVEDLFKWDRILYTNKLVSQINLQEAFTPGKLNDDSIIDIGFRDNSYGFGWRIQNGDDGRMVWHTGHFEGYSNLIMRYTDLDRTIICLSNNEYEFYAVMNIINDILNGSPVVLPHHFFR